MVHACPFDLPSSRAGELEMPHAHLRTAQAENSYAWYCTVTFSAIRIFQTLVQYAYLIVPVRSYAGSIPSSVGLPISVLANSLCVSAAQAFRSQHDFDQPRDAQEGVFDCRSDKKSASACDIARRSRIPSSDMRPLCQVIRLLINFR